MLHSLATVRAEDGLFLHLITGLGSFVWAPRPRGKDLPTHGRRRYSMGRRPPPLCPHTPEDYSPDQEVRKLRTQEKQEARGRREQAERRMTEKEEEALERREDAERWMRGRRNP